MTSAILTPRIKAASARACLRSTVLPFRSIPGASVTDRRIDQAVRFPNRSEERAVAAATPVRVWATVTAAALLVIAGAVAFDFLVHWIASGKMIERLPF